MGFFDFYLIRKATQIQITAMTPLKTEQKSSSPSTRSFRWT